MQIWDLIIFSHLAFSRVALWWEQQASGVQSSDSQGSLPPSAPQGSASTALAAWHPSLRIPPWAFSGAAGPTMKAYICFLINPVTFLRSWPWPLVAADIEDRAGQR